MIVVLTPGSVSLGQGACGPVFGAGEIRRDRFWRWFMVGRNALVLTGSMAAPMWGCSR